MPAKWRIPKPKTPVDDPFPHYSLPRKVHQGGDKVRVLRDRGDPFGDTWPDDTFVNATAGSIGTVLSVEEYAASKATFYPGELEFLGKAMTYGVCYPIRINEAMPLADKSDPGVHNLCHAGSVVKVEGCFLEKVE